MSGDEPLTGVPHLVLGAERPSPTETNRSGMVDGGGCCKLAITCLFAQVHIASLYVLCSHYSSSPCQRYTSQTIALYTPFLTISRHPPCSTPRRARAA